MNGQPSNSILGVGMPDPLSIPQAKIDDREDRAVAKFAHSKDWQRHKEFLQSRIEYWQHFLPGGQPINENIPKMTDREREMAWVIADNAIREINLQISAVEGIASGYAE